MTKPMEYYRQMPERHKSITLASVQAIAATILSILSIGIIFKGFMPKYATDSQINFMYMELKMGSLQTNMRLIEQKPKADWDQRTQTEYEGMVDQLKEIKKQRNKSIGAIGMPE